MASHLAKIHGTEEDKVNCPFYYKIGRSFFVCQSHLCTTIYSQRTSYTFGQFSLFLVPPRLTCLLDLNSITQVLVVMEIDVVDCITNQPFLKHSSLNTCILIRLEQLNYNKLHLE